MKVAVIGCGCIANAAHIPSYMNNPDVVIKYFCDIIPERAEQAVSQYGCGIAVTDYHDVIGDPEVEAVSVCTPNRMHPVIAMDALRAGKHVLCEKPAARTYAEAKEMQAVQHETGKVLNIGVVNRFNTAVNKIRELISAGTLGDVYHVYVSFRARRSIPGLGGAFTTKEIAGGGALIDWGVHYLDIVMFCTGDPKPVTVSGQAYSKLGVDMKNYIYENMWSEGTKDLNGTYDVDDSVTGLVRYAPASGVPPSAQRRVGTEHRSPRGIHRLPGRQGGHPPSVRREFHPLRHQERRAGDRPTPEFETRDISRTKSTPSSAVSAPARSCPPTSIRSSSPPA